MKNIIKYENFDRNLASVENGAWYSFEAIVQHFLGNDKTEHYEEIIFNLLKNYHKMFLKIHILHSHPIFFLKTWRA